VATLYNPHPIINRQVSIPLQPPPLPPMPVHARQYSLPSQSYQIHSVPQTRSFRSLGQQVLQQRQVINAINPSIEHSAPIYMEPIPIVQQQVVPFEQPQLQLQPAPVINNQPLTQTPLPQSMNPTVQIDQVLKFIENLYFHFNFIIYHLPVFLVRDDSYNMSHIQFVTHIQAHG